MINLWGDKMRKFIFTVVWIDRDGNKQGEPVESCGESIGPEMERAEAFIKTKHRREGATNTLITHVKIERLPDETPAPIDKAPESC